MSAYSSYMGPGPVTIEIELVAEGSEGYEDLKHHGPFILEPLNKHTQRREAPRPETLAPSNATMANPEMLAVDTPSPTEAQAEADQERMHRMTTPYEEDYQWSGCPDCNTKPCCCALPDLF